MARTARRRAADEEEAAQPSEVEAFGGGAAAPSPRSGGRRRTAAAAAADPAPSPPNPSASKKRRKERLGQDAGATSAHALAANGSNGEEAEAQAPMPLSPEQEAVWDRRLRDSDTLMDAVVKVFCTHSEPNFSLPWQRKRQYASSGSGFVIEGRRILSNAHCVDHHTQVKVKRRGSDAKHVATVLAVGAECDIALLTVEDPEFWEGLTPVRFGRLPRLQDAVTVIGFPIGGETMSVTSGVVSRVEVTSYAHGAAELLGVQVDAAINAGNSGGPAFNSRGDCVGIAFQSLKHEDAENISYIIPTPVIEHFIRDYEEHGAYTGFPGLGVEWQRLESPVLRSALGLKAGQRGVLVRRVEPTAPTSAFLSKGDVMLSFDGVDIGSDGTVPFRSGERISFSYLIQQKYMGEEAVLRVLSGGRERSVRVPLEGASKLVPVHIRQRPPSYYILGGLVFTPVTVPLLRSEYGKEYDYESPVKLLDKMMHAVADRPGQQVVVLQQVLADATNVGYEDVVNTQVLRVNGEAVNNLAELVEMAEASRGRYLRFDLEYDQVVILDKAQALAATPAILEQHGIPADRSEDLRASAATGGKAGKPQTKAKGGAAAAAQRDGPKAGGRSRKRGVK